MSSEMTASIYLNSIDPSEVEWRIVEKDEPSTDQRRALDITRDITLYVRPSRASLPGTLEALRKLAAAALELADDLEAARPAALEAPHQYA